MDDKIYLTLKWGTLKAWNFKGHEKACEILKEYSEIGSSLSAMAQKDTDRQKEILCELIDCVPDKVYLDWDDRYVSKEEAKDYVMTYGKGVGNEK